MNWRPPSSTDLARGTRFGVYACISPRRMTVLLLPDCQMSQCQSHPQSANLQRASKVVICSCMASISSARCGFQSTQPSGLSSGQFTVIWGVQVRTKVKKVVRRLLGWGFILAGTVGLFVPLMQGVLFLFVGLLILSSEYVWADHLLQKIRARFPRLSLRFEEATAGAHKWTSTRFRHTQGDVPGETARTFPWRQGHLPVVSCSQEIVLGCEDSRAVPCAADSQVTGLRPEQGSKIYPD